MSTNASAVTDDNVIDLAAAKAKAAAADLMKSAIDDSKAEDKAGLKWANNFIMNKNGLFFHENGDHAPGVKISGPFTIIGKVRDAAGENHARVLSWVDEKGRNRLLLIPAQLIQKGGHELAGLMARVGIECRPGKKSHERLAQCLGDTEVRRWIHSVSRTGWHLIDEKVVLVTGSGEVLGDVKDDVIFQSGNSIGVSADAKTAFASSGDLEEWKQHVARFAIGNDRVAFGVSAAFAAPLLRFAKEQGGGFNFFGDSQIGKTTLLAVAGSVYGPGRRDGGQINSWRATDNGLEVLAAETADFLLLLDEMGQATAAIVGGTVYMLFNNAGKIRMTEGRGRQKTIFFNASSLFSVGSHEGPLLGRRALPTS